MRGTAYTACACSPLGKVWRVSQPHAPGGTAVWTTYAYDALGRTTSVTHPDGSVTTYVYSGNWAEVHDPAGKYKSYEQNALGQMTQVYEPRPGGGEAYRTYYTYDALNHLIQVSMPRDGVTQTRTFNYDANQRLQSATNPETGTVSFAYNADGTMSYKTLANGHQIRYTYDTMQRVTAIRHFDNNNVENTCDRQDFGYDETDYYGTDLDNTMGRLTSTFARSANCQVTLSEGYSYTPGGLKTVKLNQVTNYQQPTWSVSNGIAQAYDDQGRLVNNNGRPLIYDAAGRLVEMRDGANQTLATAQWGVGGEMLQMRWRREAGWAFVQENRSYNARLQMLQQTSLIEGGQTLMDMWYRFPTNGTNNGRISSQKDYVTGEEISYQYDELNRLISAATTGPEWGLSFTYDGFGNRLQQNVTKGQAPAWQQQVDSALNRVATWAYDVNGNVTSMTGMSALTYDGYNRMASATTTGGANDQYGYDTQNRRFLKQSNNGDTFVYFHDLAGRRTKTYKIVCTGQNCQPQLQGEDIYFAGRLIVSNGAEVVTDRLGSVRVRNGATLERFKYYPYGEENGASASNRDKFGTYHRDQNTGLDYAMNRYYANGAGRFLTADPRGRSATSKDPASWNRYQYCGNDPVNLFDPLGAEPMLEIGPTVINVSDEFNPLQLEYDLSVFITLSLWSSGGEGETGSGGLGTSGGGVGGGGGTDTRPDCPKVATLPGQDGGGQIARNIKEAKEFMEHVYKNDPDHSMENLLGFLISKFKAGGDWDYKKDKNKGSKEQEEARVFGNFAFGAVLEGLGFNLYYTQSLAGLYQTYLCSRGGACGTGIPFLTPPYGDQANDQKDIADGWSFQKAKDDGCK